MNRPAGELREERLRLAAALMTRPEPLSLAQRDALLEPEDFEAMLSELGPNAWPRLLHDWRWIARPTQIEPAGDHRVWFICAGRGWGKSTTGIRWIAEGIDDGTGSPFGLIGPTRRDVLDRLVYGDEGAPGLVRLYQHLPEGLRPIVNKNDSTIKFPHTGAEGFFYTAEKPEVRGPNMRRWLCDELAYWRYLRECWDNIEMTTRARGRTPPRICITTTPRNVQVILELLDDPRVAVTFGNTFANAANVDPAWIARMSTKYAGSRLGAQELYGLVLGQNPNALFHQAHIDAARVTAPPALKRIAIAIDPAISTTRRADLTGIVVEGLGVNDELYLLADLTGVELDKREKGLVYWRPDEPKKHKPDEWGEIVCRAYRHFGREHACPVTVVGERDRGGDLVESTVRQVDKLTGGAGAVPYKGVSARRGKGVRAEEVSVLYPQGRAHHVGQLPDLENEMTEYVPGETTVSPNRLDARVYCAFDLIPELANDAPPPPARSAASLGKGTKKANDRMRDPMRAKTWDSIG